MTTEPPLIFPIKEWKDLLSDLEDHHSVFSALYSAGRPKFSTEIPTAAVYFNRAGNCIDFKTNPEFWNPLSKEEKRFVLSHEALHVFLNHGKRAINVSPREALLSNQAMDVVVNHMLVDKFHHVRSKIDKDSDYCWLDTVFKDDTEVKSGKNYEYYMARLRKNREEEKNGGKPKRGKGDGLLNDHSGLKSFGKDDEEGEEPTDKQLKDFLKRAMKGADMKDLIEKLNQAGAEVGGLTKIMEEMQCPVKRKWETVIRDWSHQFQFDTEEEQFVLTNRRYAMLPRNQVFLPTAGDVENSEKQRIEVWFFIDTSGSCSHLAPRLFSAAMSLPKDRFKVRLFCFDTRVYDVDPVKRELSGFGGTSFQCIETHIQRTLMDEKRAYPKAVFLLTDGYGDHVQPEFPKRWHWFLSCDFQGCIPKDSRVFKLEDFE